MSVRHTLKIEYQWYLRIKDRTKVAEVRIHDRDYQAGDSLLLHIGRFDLRDGVKYVTAKVTHVLSAKQFPDGIQPGYCVLSLANISDEQVWVEKKDEDDA